jgi:glutamine synthetase
MLTVLNIKLFSKHKVLSEGEMHSRYEITMENYTKTIHIEALTMADMVKKGIIPSALSYLKDLTEIACNKKALNASFDCQVEENLIGRISDLASCIYKNLQKLEDDMLDIKNQTGVYELAKFFRETIFVDMQVLRAVVDELESLVGKKYWPYPTYAEILYSVQ